MKTVVCPVCWRRVEVWRGVVWGHADTAQNGCPMSWETLK